MSRRPGLVATVVLVTAGATAIEAPPAEGARAADPPGTITVGTYKFGIALMPGAVFTADAYGPTSQQAKGLLVRNSLSGTATTVVAGPAQTIGRVTSNLVAASAYRVMSDQDIRYGTGAPKPARGWMEAFSGTRAVISPVGTYQLLYDVRAGALQGGWPPTAWYGGPSALFGNYLVYARPLSTGTQIRRRDLGTGKDMLVGTAGRDGVSDVAVNGNIVAWLNRCLTSPCTSTVAYRIVSGSGTLGPVKAFVTPGTRWLDLSATHLALDVNGQLRLVTLGSHVVRLIGTLTWRTGETGGSGTPDYPPQVPVPFDLDGDRIGWIDADQNAKVTPLGTPPARARYLGNGLIMPWFTPNGDGRYDHFGASLPFSKNLTRCAVTFRKGTTAVRTVPCLVRNGDVLIIWDGRNSAGRLVPKGRYQWTLTGSDAAGPALWYTGSGARIGATVEVR